MDLDFKYMVVTRCFTYNHAQYIIDALNGFSIQETTFPVVYVIVDDASVDGEQVIIREWAKDNLDYENSTTLWKDMSYGKLAEAPLKGKPQLVFAIILLAENHYQSGKGSKRLDYTSQWDNNAKYRAICEGDDYWTDPLKLEKQVTFLEMHNDYVLTYTDSDVVNQYSQKVFHRNPLRFSGHITEKLIKRGNFIDTATVCHLNKDKEWLEVRSNIPFKLKMGDKPKWIYYSTLGKVKYLKDKTTVYRLLPESASHTKDIQKAMAFIDNTAEITRYFNEFYNIGIKESNIKRKCYVAKVREAAKFSKTEFIYYWRILLTQYPWEIFNMRINIIGVLRVLFNMSV